MGTCSVWNRLFKYQHDIFTSSVHYNNIMLGGSQVTKNQLKGHASRLKTIMKVEAGV